MANLYAIAETSLRASPPDYAQPNERGGKVRCLYDKFTVSADMAAADIIHFGKIPKGARVLEVVLKSADLDASGGTVDVGWAAGAGGVETGDADGFLDDVDVTSADTFKMTDDLANAAGLYKEFSEEVDVIVTTDGDTDATSGDIELCVWYVLD